MKFIPRHNQILGRIVIRRMLSTIIRPDETKNTTKFILVDAVGPGAEAAGIKVGDVVLVTTMSNIWLDGGVSFRPLADEKNVAAVVTGVTLDDLVVQDDGANKFVAFSDPEAAQSLGESQPEKNGATAHAAPDLRAMVATFREILDLLRSAQIRLPASEPA